MAKYRRARGAQFKLAGTKIGNVTKITPPASMKREMADISGIEDLYDTVLPCSVDPGTLSIKGNCGDATLESTLLNNFNADDTVAWEIDFHDGTVYSGLGALQDTSFEEGDRKGVFTFSATIKISGGITWSSS